MLMRTCAAADIVQIVLTVVFAETLITVARNSEVQGAVEHREVNHIIYLASIYKHN